MNIEDELNNYGIPTINYDRSTYNYRKRVKTTGNVGEIIPFYVNMLVQPGDTFKISVTDFERLTTSKFPTMDNLYRNIYFFSVSWLALWDHAREFWGENTDANFDIDVEYTIPSYVIKADDEIGNRDILNRLGMPHKRAEIWQFANQTQDILFERLAHNMYLHIYNNFFRDQSYTPAYKFSKGDEDIDYSELTMPKTLLKACRFHDYFNGIPEPQYGEQVTIKAGETAQVKGNGKALGITNGTTDYPIGWSTGTENKYITLGATGNIGNDVGTTRGNIPSISNTLLGLSTNGENSGVIADLANSIGTGINVLRMDIAEQHIKEKLAWYGRLYQNIVQSMWGVEANQQDLRLPIYLGGNRAPLNMDTVLQTSSTDATSPQGEPAGYSATLNNQGEVFTKSFTEHSIIMGLVVVRQDHTYSQGIDVQHTKRRKMDFYFNEMAGLGAQDILNKEICVTGTATDDEKWACKPAWQEYRMEKDEVTGQLAPNAVGTLVNYTYADNYGSLPVAGTSWLEETPIYVDRTLTTQYTVADQLMFDFNIDIVKTTEVPAYNLPGINRI